MKTSPRLKNQSDDREREQHEQVEVPHRERAPPVDEPDQEERRRSRARWRVVDLAPPNAPSSPRAIFQATCGPVQASVTTPCGRRPCRGRSGPASSDQTLTRPVPTSSSNVGVARQALRRVALQPVPHLRLARKIARARSPSAAPARAPARTASGQVALAVVDRRGRRGRRVAAPARRAEGDQPRSHQASQRPERSRACSPTKFERRHEHDRDRLRGDLGHAERDSTLEQRRGSRQRDQRDDEERSALVGDVAALAAERPQPVPRVVVRHGDEERARPRRAVVDARRRARRAEKTARLTAYAGRADRAELRELEPVLPAAQRVAGAGRARGRRPRRGSSAPRRARASAHVAAPDAVRAATSGTPAP